jgi:UDP-glucose 6-dehydrogenase
MKVWVCGLWHLGSVTAACLASRGFATVGLAETPEVAAELNAVRAPLFEPGLDALLKQGLQSGTLLMTSVLDNVERAGHSGQSGTRGTVVLDHANTNLPQLLESSITSTRGEM